MTVIFTVEGVAFIGAISTIASFTAALAGASFAALTRATLTGFTGRTAVSMFSSFARPALAGSGTTFSF